MTFTAILATFEDETAEIINRVSALFPDATSGPLTRPHITLAIYDSLPFSKLKEAIVKMPLPSHTIVHFPSIGQFLNARETMTLFFALSPTESLLNLQKELTKSFVTQTSQLYRSGFWYPHATIALGLAQNSHLPIEAVSEIVQLPMTGWITGVTLTEISLDRQKILQQLNMPLTSPPQSPSPQ